MDLPPIFSSPSLRLFPAAAWLQGEPGADDDRDDEGDAMLVSGLNRRARNVSLHGISEVSSMGSSLGGTLPSYTAAGGDATVDANGQPYAVTGTVQQPVASSSSTTLHTHATAWHVWGLAISVVLGGDYVGWNVGLKFGLGPFFAATVVVGLGYVLLCACLGELTSSIPYSGGSYGFARVTMGRVVGLIVGIAETIDYVFYVSSAGLLLGSAMTTMTGLDRSLEPLWVFLFYFTGTVIHIIGGRRYWNSMIIFAVVQSLLLFVFYFICYSIPGFGIKPNALSYGAELPEDPTTASEPTVFSRGGASGFFEILPLAMWWWIGVEQCPLAAEETHQPMVNVPRGMMAAVYTLLGHAFLTLFTLVSVPGGIDTLKDYIFPLNFGFAAKWPEASQAGTAWWTTLYSMPATFSTFYVFMYGYGRQSFALARAGLVPAWLGRTMRSTGTPYAATIFFSLVGYITCLIVQLGAPSIEVEAHWTTIVLNMSLLGAMVCYILVFVAYALMWRNMHYVDRQWRSPFGIVGAVTGCIIFALCIVGFVVYGSFVWQALLYVLGIYALWFVYYFTVSRHHTILSPEDRFALQMRVTAERMLLNTIGYYYLFHACEDMARTNQPSARAAQLALDCWKQCQNALECTVKAKRAKLILYIYDRYLSKFTAKDGLPIDRSALSAKLFAWVRQVRSTGRDLDGATNESNMEIEIEQLLQESQKQVVRVLDKVVLPYFHASPAFEQFLAKEPLLGS